MRHLWDAGYAHVLVDDKRRLCRGGETHRLLGQPKMVRLRLPVMGKHERKRVLFTGLVTEVERCRGPSPLPRRRGNPVRMGCVVSFSTNHLRTVPDSLARADPVNIVEDHILRNCIVAIVFTESVQSRVRNVVDTRRHLSNSLKHVRRVWCIYRLLISVSREASCARFIKVVIRHCIDHDAENGF